MDEINLLEKYCEYHPDFLDRIKDFPEREKILNKLKKIKNKTSFLSVITEHTFGELFHEKGFSINCDKKYNKSQTPDWTIKIDNEN
jgi:hypothetical protein